MVNRSEYPSYASFPVFKSLDPNRRSRLDRLLSVFADVRGGEGAGALLLFANIFLLLTAYYLLKTAREPLILTQYGAEVKTYLSAGQALLLLAVLPAYSWLASRVKRVRLLAGVSLFFTANLAIFYYAAAGGAAIGMAFYLWVGIFSLFAISQFWAFANDLYSEAQGKRLFPLIGAGASIGAVAGAKAASLAAERLGALPLLPMGAALLAACAALTAIADARISVHGGQQQAREKPLAPGDGFALLLRDRYLVFIALLVFLLNVVNTSGEFLLSSLVSEQAGRLPGGEEARGRFIGAFYGDFFFWVNLLGMGLQMFAVSRLFRYIGVGGALFLLPLAALSGYALLAAAPVLGVIRVLKIIENGIDYSVQNTARQALFLPTPRDVKYKAKAVIDTFFQRAGDVTQAGIVYAGTQVFSLGMTGFAGLNLLLTAAWLALVTALSLEYRKRAGAAAPEAPAAG